MNPTPWGTYTQIANTLRHRITNGHLKPGSPLPPESALGQEFHVSRTTIRRALAVLETHRLIRTIPGTGRIVCDPNETPPGNQPRYRHIANKLRNQINHGDLSPGDPVPSESTIAHQYGVSRATARRALSVLEGARLVVSVQGKGRFVHGHGAHPS